MIYNLLRGTVLHTTPNLVKSILNNAERISPATASQHFICVAMFGGEMLYKNVDKNPYEKIFQEREFTQYRLFYNKREFLKFVLTRKSSDKFIIHGNMDVKFHLLTNILFLLFRRDLMRRSNLICWGNNDFVRGKKLKTMITLGLIRKWSYNLYQNVLTLSQGDREEAQKLYPRAHVIYLPYFTIRRELKIIDKNKSEKCRVMVSHSGWSENKHATSFRLLSKYVPNIQVTCPLCYGDADYIEKVINEGKKTFGKDFYYFKDLLPAQDYFDLLQSMDAYVTAAERQTGLAAAYKAMEGGLKLYVTGNNLSSMKKDGYIVYDIIDIEHLTLDEFRNPLSMNEMKGNVEIYNKTHCDGKELLEGWKRVYEE